MSKWPAPQPAKRVAGRRGELDIDLTIARRKRVSRLPGVRVRSRSCLGERIPERDADEHAYREADGAGKHAAPQPGAKVAEAARMPEVGEAGPAKERAIEGKGQPSADHADFSVESKHVLCVGMPER